MDLPIIFKEIGIVHEDRLVYIEEYVLQYLEMLTGEENRKEEKFLFYGRRERTSKGEIYIIYGVCGQEEGEAWRGRRGKGYEQLGSLDIGKWKKGGDLYREISIGIGGEERAADGFYIFYDADEKMKEYLSQLYEKNRIRMQSIGQRGQEKSNKKQAELVALSSKWERDTDTPFIWIRIAAIGILAIFCAIAVITINEYDKIMDFVQTAAWTIMNCN